MSANAIQLQTTPTPRSFSDVAPVPLSDDTMRERKKRLLARMRDEGYDVLVIYADKEHGGNFEYLTGFVPRFEEALLVLHVNGQASLILGNENLKMAKHCRIPAAALHSPLFSLPNQPMHNDRPLAALLEETGLASAANVGLVGWKMFTSGAIDRRACFDLPWFIVDAVKRAVSPDAGLENAAHLFIGDGGVRTVNGANEIAHYEYGANLASGCMLAALDAVAPGVRETELGALLSAEGQYHSVVSIAAAGERFQKANFYPTWNRLERGQPLSLTTGFRGGLSSRTGFIIEREDELPAAQSDYLDRVVKPYFAAVVAWLENIRIGMPGGELYALIERILPRERYGWHLNPGHLCAEEEWMASPIYAGSQQRLMSGMILQIDIIPSVPGYTGTSAEEGIALADAALRAQIAADYPALWARIAARRAYIREVLNIDLPEEVIPLSNAVAYLRPFLLAREKSLVCGR